MHGLIYRSFENFIRNSYDPAIWSGLMTVLDTGFDGFEPMFHYDDGLIGRIVDLAADRLGQRPEDLLEDFGTYLVADPSAERVRRLLRFGGVDYEDFILSLEELHGRTRLAVPDLDLPEIEVEDTGDGGYRVICRHSHEGAVHILRGLLRALADDYGALVLIEPGQPGDPPATLRLQLLERAFGQDRGFALAQRVSG
ncbi:heme NO-binding domain-containing protein [Maritimibacter fusiformis]|uniref:Heme NO-binding protein n=1 Tax=Maritimibacter fusiformis TaxID=2603819 RepID=A0A5D0RJC2_9RHOB|nr:heme NO-binding domain-containing protein [Maritimibacter fusiformis]TYB81021.1 heme NO-binding protein [Maritimibacter fusiformis]